MFPSMEICFMEPLMLLNRKILPPTIIPATGFSDPQIYFY